jgi:hypothetical protein
MNIKVVDVGEIELSDYRTNSVLFSAPCIHFCQCSNTVFPLNLGFGFHTVLKSVMHSILKPLNFLELQWSFKKYVEM